MNLRPPKISFPHIRLFNRQDEQNESGKAGKVVLTRPRIVIIVACSVILAAVIVYVIFLLVQNHEADTLTEETIEDYLIPEEAGEEAGDETEELAALGDEFVSSESGGEFQIDWDGLWAVNPDVCAWIQVPAIPDINYPVVHYTDNDYYLRRSWRGEYLNAGCIMVDYHCSPDFTDFHTIVYGHNMDTGTMFGQLKKFQDQSFYDNNDDAVIIYLPDATLYYTIFSVQVVNPDDPSVYTVGNFNHEEATAFVKVLSDSSQIETGVKADGNDKILTLSTCSGSGATKRLTVSSELKTALDKDGNDVASQFENDESEESAEQQT